MPFSDFSYRFISLFYDADFVKDAKKAYPSSRIPAALPFTLASKPVSGVESVSAVDASPSHERNAPGAHRCGDECNHGGLTNSPVPPKLKNQPSMDGDGRRQWNTPETHCRGNESFQGDQTVAKLKICEKIHPSLIHTCTNTGPNKRFRNNPKNIRNRRSVKKNR